MDKSDQQAANLRRIYSEARLAPVLRYNDKYTYDGTPRISYTDIMDSKYVIRSDDDFPDSGRFWGGKGAPIIAEYRSLEELVADGWELD